MKQSFHIRKICTLEAIKRLTESDPDHFYKAEIAQSGEMASKVGEDEEGGIKDYTGRF